MKRFLTIVAALALVLGLSQCRKPNAPTINGIGGTQHVVLQASFDNGNSKIAQNGTGLKWEVGDIITVRKNGVALNPGTLTCTNAANGTFVGEIAETTGEITFTFGTENFMNQTGKLNNAIYLTSGDVSYEPSGSYNSVEMKMSQTTAILKLDLSYLGSTTKADDGATVTVKVDDNTIATIKNVKSSSTEMYVALPINYPNTEKAYVFSSTNGKNLTFTWTLDGNTFFTADGGSGGAIVVVPTVNFGTPNIEWAVCNLGATNGATAESWYGNYYAWGETTAYNEVPNAYPSDWTGNTNNNYSTLVTGNTKKTSYIWGNYKWGTPHLDDVIIHKYTGDDSYGSALNADDDAAHVVWGSDWRIPTKDEWQQLINNNTFVYLTAGVECNDVLPSFTPVTNGLLVVKGGKNSISLDNTKYMFLPAAGMWSDELEDESIAVCYLASSLGLNRYNSSGLIYNPSFQWMTSPEMDYYLRCCGLSVRPVRSVR